MSGVAAGLVLMSVTACVPAHEDAVALGALLERAAEGPLRVLVRLDVPFIPEGHLSEAVRADQRARIAVEKQGLVGRLTGLAASPVRSLEGLPYLALVVDEQALAVLIADPAVVSVEVDRRSAPLLPDSVPLVGGDAAGAEGADGGGWTVAVLDTGVAGAHPHLEGKVVSEACYSQDLCPDGTTASTAPGSGVPCEGIEGCDHGTHVAAIATAVDATWAGVAPGADLIAIQVFSSFEGDSCGSASSPCLGSWDSDLMEGMLRVAALGEERDIAAVNLSLGEGAYASACDGVALESAVDTLRSHGIATIAASGNAGETDALSYPACLSKVVSVGSTTNEGGHTEPDVVSSFSNSAEMLDLFAPGHFVFAAVPGGVEGMAGTSMAAPHVAGAWAALKSHTPGASIADVREALTRTGVLLTDPKAPEVTRPRLQVDAALEALLEEPLVVEPPEVSPGAGSHLGPVTVTLTSPTPGATLRYTLDGTTPSPTWGTPVESGARIDIASSATLQAVATLEEGVVSDVLEASYVVGSWLDVVLEPAEAVADGAEWRFVGQAREGFESGDLTRFDWRTTGDGAWYVRDLGSGIVNDHVAAAPLLDPGERASLELTFESDGGEVAFTAYVHTAGGSPLCFSIDDVEQECWSGDTGWLTASFAAPAGPRDLRWTYHHDTACCPEGPDAALLWAVTLPGDHWRPAGTAPWVLSGSHTLAFSAPEGWVPPEDKVVEVFSGEVASGTATYAPRPPEEEEEAAPEEDTESSSADPVERPEGEVGSGEVPPEEKPAGARGCVTAPGPLGPVLPLALALLLRARRESS